MTNWKKTTKEMELKLVFIVNRVTRPDKQAKLVIVEKKKRRKILSFLKVLLFVLLLSLTLSLDMDFSIYTGRYRAKNSEKMTVTTNLLLIQPSIKVGNYIGKH